MSLIREFTRIIGEGKRQYSVVKAKPLLLTEELGEGGKRENCLCFGDNKVFMKTLLQNYDMGKKINLIYIDPPFFSHADYDAVLSAGEVKLRHKVYGDRWERGISEYLSMLTARLLLMRDLLADDGLLWVHLDWHVVHYVKVILDEIFGEKNFVNEIIWTYKSGGTGRRHFSRKHDTLLVYSKTGSYKFFPLKEKSYNRQFKPYRFKGVKEYKDELGWYTMVNMKDVWNIDMVGRTSAERTGYATQKPEQLLLRILEACTEEGDLCADFFCGSGTLAAAAAKLNRRYIGCDKSRLAIESTIRRLSFAKTSLCVCSFEEEKSSKLKAEFDFCEEDILESEKKLLSITLQGVKNQGMLKEVEEKSRAAVEKILEENSLALVESWSVDFHYDGKVHRPEAVFTRKGKKLDTVCQKVIGGSCSISIKTVDIFGNVAFERSRE